MKKDSLGDRMKGFYESRGRLYLTRRTPVILRLDGKAFHTFTKNFTKPFDQKLSDMMTDTGQFLCENIQGAKLAYVQSDEISILITDFDKLTTDAWFGYETSKMNSIASSFATAKFNQLNPTEHLAYFDCRAFNIPREEIPNYFRWRYQDWLRNSIQMLSQANFSHKELHKKNQADMHEMLFQKGINWNDLDPLWKNGTLIYKDSEVGWYKDTNIAWIKSGKNFVDFCNGLIREEE